MKHISFSADIGQHIDDSESYKSRDRTRSLSASSSSLGPHPCRRVYVALLVPEPLEIETMVELNSYQVPLYKTPNFLVSILSPDFEEAAVEELGMRRLTVYLSNYLLPEDDEDALERRSNATGVSSHSDMLKRENEEELILCPYGFLRTSDDCCDEVIRRSHVEISRGKGGVFTRSTYRQKVWDSIRDGDLRKADIVVLAFCETSASEDSSTFTGTLARVGYDANGCLEEFDEKNGPASCVSPDMLLFVESLCQNRKIYLYVQEEIPKRLQSIADALEELKKVRICSDPDELFSFMSEEREGSWFNEDELFKRVSTNPFRNDEEILSWIKSCIS